jgi:hypothetical protein
MNVIEEKEKEGKTVYLGLTVEYQPLKWWVESGNKMENEVNEKIEQQGSLFEVLSN